MDQELLDLFEPFDPKYNTPALSTPFKLGGYLTLLSPGNHIVTEFLEDKSEDRSHDAIVSKLKFIKVK